MYYLLGVIIMVLCAAVGILAGCLVGYLLLGLFGLSNNHRLRLKLTALLFALPAGIAGAWVGYWVWKDLFPTP